MTQRAKPPLRPPAARRLRVYAFDPNASLDLASAKFSHATISLAWDKVSDGPVNEYIEVIDVDPCSGQFYPSLDLDAPEVLGQDGLPPSEGDPRFHQQMVFAVIMKTIKLFERALGRRVIWSPKWNDERKTYEPVERLRVYPHALREANAYYSPTKKALLFGYFNASQRSAGANWIFTCLSHDIIVHETTHAILDGLHRRYAEPTSIDSLAFHEAFADIAALFSHFQLYEAVYDYIDKSCGRLDESGLLSGLASQFAKGTTGRSSLRDYIDRKPDQDALEAATEPHERGAILVAAVFDAFLSIYMARTSDLLRMMGVRPGQGASLHPDLVARLTKEATKSADHVLRMCIRALDYLPPVDVRFGEFLRAIITADSDLIPDDRLNYRLAFVEAFRRRGIFPENCLSMSPDNLLWDPQPQDETDAAYLDVRDLPARGLELVPLYKRSEVIESLERNRRVIWYWLVQPGIKRNAGMGKALRGRLDAILEEAPSVFAQAGSGPRDKTAAQFVNDIADDLAELGVAPGEITRLQTVMASRDSHFAKWEAFFGALVTGANVQPDHVNDRRWEKALGIYFQRPTSPSLLTISSGRQHPTVEVHSVRTTRRAGPDGQDIRQMIIEVTQRRDGYYETQDQQDHDNGASTANPHAHPFVFRGGATLIVDLSDGRHGKLRYIISKRIDDEARLDRQRQFLLSPGGMSFTYTRNRANEPFALLHRH